MIGSLGNFLANWLVFSALYALTAIGFTIIFGVGGVLNLAHGASVTLGAFGTLLTYRWGRAMGLEINAAVAIGVLVAIAIVILFNLVIYRILVRGLQRVYENPEQEALVVMIMTLLVALIVEQGLRLYAGSNPLGVPVFVAGTLPGTRVEMNLVLGFFVSWLAIAGIFLLVNRTMTGRALVAASMSRRGAEITGVNIGRLYIVTWILAGSLAAIAGVFLGSFETAVYSMGRDPLIISFAIVVLGGLGSIRGSVIAAYIVGFLEIATTSFIDPTLTGMTAFAVLILVLLVRPEGLFGRELQVGG